MTGGGIPIVVIPRLVRSTLLEHDIRPRSTCSIAVRMSAGTRHIHTSDLDKYGLVVLRLCDD